MLGISIGTIIGLIFLVFVILVLISCVKVVRQAQALVVERLGGYQATWSVGIHFKMPFIDRVARRVDLKEQVVDFPPQPVITKDNVTMRIDTVVFYQITDPKLFAYGVENPMNAIENLTATTLRNIIGELELDGHLGGHVHVLLLLLGENLEHDDIFLGHAAVVDQAVLPAEGVAFVGQGNILSCHFDLL